jgi:hypothetical protein
MFFDFGAIALDLSEFPPPFERILDEHLIATLNPVFRLPLGRLHEVAADAYAITS